MSDSDSVSSRSYQQDSDTEESLSSSDTASLTSDNVSADVSDISIKSGPVNISMIKGEIGRQKADVLVNTTSTDLKLNVGGVSKGLLSVAGDALQNECNTKYPNGIAYGDIAVTSGAQLQCKEVYHLCLRTWNGDQTRQDLARLVSKCLSTASDAGHTSIAFPALGTGLNKYPKETVAKTIFSCIENYQRHHSDTSLRNIRCVIYPADNASMEAFLTRCRKISPTEDTSDREICAVSIHSQTVHLLVGNIVEQNCDIIVTTSTRRIKLTGGRLSHNVLDKAGPNLQTEVEEKYPRGIRHGEIAILSPGGLPCSHLYCGALPRHDRPPEGSEPPEVLFRKLVITCLNQAMNDGATSICFPTIGTGYLMYKPEVSAKNMFQAISEYANDNPRSSIDIYIVIRNSAESLKKNLKVFERIIHDYEEGKSTPTPRTRRQRRGRPQPGSLGTESREPAAESAAYNAIGGSDQIGGARGGTISLPPERNTPEFCLHMYGTEIRPPSYWTKFTSDKTTKDWKVSEPRNTSEILIDVDQSTFNIVDKLIQRTWEVNRIGHGRDAAGLNQLGYNKLKVTKVQRVENLTLYDNYKHMQQQMFHRAAEGTMFTTLSKIPGVKIGEPSTFKKMDQTMKDTLYTEVNEGYFFHGTRKDKLFAKVKEGLDPRLANTGAVFGQAVYMSESSTKADQYTDDRNQRQRDGLTMLLVRCSMGDICLMTDTKKLTRPPCKVTSCCSDTCTHEERYNSVVEEGKYIFREFCVYDRLQVYPEYVITYDRVKI